jgi:ankyrin repeat protein
MYEDEFQVHGLLDKWNPFGPPTPDGVIALFNQKPTAAEHIFSDGQTLLHKCMQDYSNRMDLVQIFIEAYPEALTHEDNQGCLPIHLALTAERRAPNLELVKLLILKAPETILDQTSVGKFPLHLACQRCDASVVKFLIDCFPDILHYRDRSGKFPLDYALDQKDINVEVMKILLDQNRVLLTFIDDDGSLPLHRILRRNHRNFDTIVDILTDVCPGALRFQNSEGQTPLLQACSEFNSLSQVYTLVRRWPEQVTTQAGMLFYETSFNGELLPSALVSKSSTLYRVRKWINMYPEVVLSPDTQGRLPIHYAAVSSSDDAVDVIQFLMEISESSVSRADQYGRLPLHYACGSPSCDEDRAEALINAFPEGLRHADNDGRLPWHYADRARNSFVFDRTFELFPEIDTDLNMVPDEIRWDILQIIQDDAWLVTCSY